MSAPPLPEVFGNYALGDFVEVVAPPGVDWLPQTPGWWVVGALVAALSLRSAWRQLRRWYRDRYRREALARLAQLKQAPTPGSEFLREVNILLKLTAIAANSREEVASLTGRAWPDYLNAQCVQPVFDHEQAPLLASGSYGSPEVDTGTRAEIVSSAALWIRIHQDRHA